MLKLYYSPAAVSLVSHIALEETGLEYQRQEIALRDGEHLREAYRRIHPLSRLPALEIADGTVLTETPALLWYLADLAPERKLMPSESLERARANEWLSLFASALHVTFITFFRPSRYTDDSAAQTALKSDGKGRFMELLSHVEARLPDSGFLLGERYTLCDANAAIFFMWARHFGLPVERLPRYARLFEAVTARPAVKRALAQEGLGRASPAVA
ncbi:MAG TPA: glutathione S-transferase N-terminal domain-containing protein [Polyangiaceae bacterium]|nr:glutathione S-transferase N-terminal domain-containing protein [Polyangiaceae bacterium]